VPRPLWVEHPKYAPGAAAGVIRICRAVEDL
jgi:hypothetical protein